MGEILLASCLFTVTVRYYSYAFTEKKSCILSSDSISSEGLFYDFLESAILKSFYKGNETYITMGFWAVAKELFFIQNKTLWTYSCQI